MYVLVGLEMALVFCIGTTVPAQGIDLEDRSIARGRGKQKKPDKEHNVEAINIASARA